MKNINKILNEEIKSRILEVLMKSDSSFSELLEETNLRDHGQLNYHLNVLTENGIIKKLGGKYSKTSLGERMGVYLKQFQSKEMYPVSVVCAIVKSADNKILMLKRAKSPQKDKWAFPGGKIALGESIKQTAERELFEETALDLKFKKALGFFPTIVHTKNELNFHANIIPVLMESFSPSKKINLNKDEHSDWCFVCIEESKHHNLVATNRLILENLDEEVFAFKEIIHKE